MTEAAASGPWAQVSLDFGSFPNGRHTVVMIDSYSKFPMVEVVPSTSFETVKPVLDCVFALFGLPEVLRTDNGPPFQGMPFREHMAVLGVTHRKVTPQWPQANGEVERLMRTLNKAFRIGVSRGENLEECLQSFLRAYCNTPHSTTKCSPSDLLMPHAGRDLVPASEAREPTTLDLQAAQGRRKRNNDKASEWPRAKVVQFQPGALVVVRNRRPGGTFCTRYEPNTWEVVRQHGTMVTVRRNGTQLTRNVSWFKLVPRAYDSGGGESPEARGDGGESESGEGPFPDGAADGGVLGERCSRTGCSADPPPQPLPAPGESVAQLSAEGLPVGQEWGKEQMTRELPPPATLPWFRPPGPPKTLRFLF